jgi:hypothetical protein
VTLFRRASNTRYPALPAARQEPVVARSSDPEPHLPRRLAEPSSEFYDRPGCLAQALVATSHQLVERVIEPGPAAFAPNHLKIQSRLGRTTYPRFRCSRWLADTRGVGRDADPTRHTEPL